ncbi:MAG: hypothetical protein R3A45_06580 [Bdellovibrionota bacterium]
MFDNNLSTTEKQIKDIRDALGLGLSKRQRKRLQSAKDLLGQSCYFSQPSCTIFTANLGNYLSSVSANQTEDKIIAAVALMKIGATPCTRLGFKFGDDNHKDLDLVTESQQTINSIADMNFLWNELKSVNMEDQVVFALINVFGRTLEDKRPGNGNDKGRDHNLDHNVGLVFGPGVKPGVSGGLDAAAQNRKAAAFNSGNGGLSNPDISYGESHASLAKTIFALCGVNEERIKTRVTAGKIIDNMLL